MLPVAPSAISASTGHTGRRQRPEHPAESPFEERRTRDILIAAHAAAVRGRLPFSQFRNVLGHNSSGVTMIVGIVVIIRSHMRASSR